MMSAEERRLADLLKRAVPEPPRELSADQVTVVHTGRRPGPWAGWARPALAAAAVLAIGVTTGVVVQNAGPGATSAPRGSGQQAASASSSSSSAGCTPASPGRGVTAPSVIGMPAVQAEQTLAQDGLTVKVAAGTAPAGQHVPAGTVFSQSPAAGATVQPGAVITVTMAAAQGSPPSFAASVSASGSAAATGPASPCPAAPASQGEKNVVVPTLLGLALTAAQQMLAQDGLTVKVAAGTAPAGQHAPAGTVLSQSPAPGTTVPPGATITVTVAAKVP